MKKIVASLLLAGMLSLSTVSTFAVVSPQGDPTEKEGKEKAPKTGDINIAFVETAGIVCAVVAVAAAKRRKQA